MPGRGYGQAYQGMNWIHGPTRYAIYWRDRDPNTNKFRCVWCLRPVEPWQDGHRARLRICLDHLIPHCHGGNNSAHNLVTSCFPCNNQRGGQSWEDLLESPNIDDVTVQRVRGLTGRPLTEEERAKGRALWRARHRGRRTSDSRRPHWTEGAGR